MSTNNKHQDRPAGHHPVDDFKISPRQYSGEEREFGRIANPSRNITIDELRNILTAPKPRRVSWSDGEKPSEIYVAAYIPPERWNGWAKPYFSHDECVRLAASQSAFNDSVKFEYDPFLDAWQEFNTEENYRQDCPSLMVAGERCHQVGSGFTWLELPDEPPRTGNAAPNPMVKKPRVRPRIQGRHADPGPAGDPWPALSIPGSADSAGPGL